MIREAYTRAGRNHAIARILPISALVAALLLLCSHLFDWIGFLVLLYPGEILGLLITGGHGGTRAEQYLAMAVSFAVNTTLYTLIGTIAVSAARALRRR